ncbi:MAG: DNA adenine methylase [Anaerolineaceae bacterium]|nr:DNA adenine methylase [Anaerolineaceae bacterium]
MAQQLSLFDLPHNKVINVSAVSQRSPFRYPGGKTWLVPRIYPWLISQSTRPKELIEPFAGGAIIGLTVAFERLADHVTLVELDEQVASVWQTIITDGDGEWLARRIVEFNLTPENVREGLSAPAISVRERAFQTILKNRTSHGGILASGAGLIKNGENGKGIASRWYPKTLASRIRDIHAIRDRLTFIQGDAFDVIEKRLNQPGAMFFVDPPYTAGKNGKRAASRLYTYFQINHERLFDMMEAVSGDFLLTYDNDQYVRELTLQHGFKYVPIAMTNTHHAEMNELLINRNLDWVTKVNSI